MAKAKGGRPTSTYKTQPGKKFQSTTNATRGNNAKEFRPSQRTGSDIHTVPGKGA